jgi:hypothetical protein
LLWLTVPGKVFAAKVCMVDERQVTITPVLPLPQGLGNVRVLGILPAWVPKLELPRQLAAAQEGQGTGRLRKDAESAR